MNINWSKCNGHPDMWPYKEQEDFRNLNLRSGKVFLIPLLFFKDHLDHNPAYINIESRSLISHRYQGFDQIAITLFNPQDITMFRMLAGGNVKTKINNFDYVWPEHIKHPQGTTIIKWACGTYTEYHSSMGSLTKATKKKMCIPIIGQSSIFYSVRSCSLTHEEFWNNDEHHKRWRSELHNTFTLVNIKSINDMRSFYKFKRILG
jgi:hypothetical protein